MRDAGAMVDYVHIVPTTNEVRFFLKGINRIKKTEITNMGKLSWLEILNFGFDLFSNESSSHTWLYIITYSHI